MKTKDEVLKAMKICASPENEGVTCAECPYCKNEEGESCVDVMMRDARLLIEAQAQELEQLKK